MSPAFESNDMPADPHDTHRHWMRRALRLAMNGRGRAEPNPTVGCVITSADGTRVLGEGFHEQFGGPHAEPNALAACAAAGASPAGATVYTTLEPCCHANKKTPPCVPRLIEAKVGRVVIGCIDPDPGVDGRGAAQLRAAGIDVVTGVLEAECKELIAPFIATTVHRRPYVTLKWAETADRKVAGPGGRRVQISGPESQRLVHQLRARSDAVLVGINTVLADDPLLTARGVDSARPSPRVVLDRRLRVPLDSRLVRSLNDAALIVGTTTAAAASAPDKVAALRAAGAVVHEWDRLETALFELADVVGITHLLVEPGPTLARSFIEKNLADRVWLFRSTDVINDPTAPAAARVPYPPVAQMPLGRDTLTEYLNPASPVFFAAEPSADFVLAAAAATGAKGAPSPAE
jgi:diaminohydroxyphosphoribosylaminopyrimidine deaminase/5-amino-6-(5-phosphoribosylamino)uracil reductase